MKRLGRESGNNQINSAFWTHPAGRFSAQWLSSFSHIIYPPRVHSEYVITVCLEGEVVRKQFDTSQTAKPGESLISNFGISHETSYHAINARGCEAVALAVDRQLLADMAVEFSLPPTDANHGLAFTGTFGNEIIQICARGMTRELKQRGAGHSLILESIAMRLLAEILRAWPRNQIISIPVEPKARLSQRDFIRAYEFMRSCRKEAFRVEHLCSFLGSSEENFTRLFSASLGRPPASFYNRMLLERGRDLLCDSNLSIKEISFELGFKTTSHFIVAFRREFNFSPQKYRSQPPETSAA